MHTLVHEQDIRDEGIEIGKELGINQGLLQAQTSIVINALNSGMTESEITTKLLIPAEIVEDAKKELLLQNND